jgi:hypothetical protein
VSAGRCLQRLGSRKRLLSKDFDEGNHEHEELRENSSELKRLILILNLRPLFPLLASVQNFLAPFCYFGIATTLFRVAICAPCFFDRHFCYLLPSRLD